MNVLVLGADGYIGWPLCLSLGKVGHDVIGIDSQLRRELVSKSKSISASKIADYSKRADLFEELKYGELIHADLMEENFHRTMGLLSSRGWTPEAIVHLAEIPSAPYSMKGVQESIETQYNNVLGTLNLLWTMRELFPEAHLLKLGTMGEYGTPDCPIPEGTFPPGARWYDGLSKDVGEEWESHNISGMLFPRKGPSFYHLSKIHDTYNIEFACRNWGLRATDVMQGVVYGTWNGVEILMHDVEASQINTRLDFDECFGTAINRFVVQAILGHPLTVYGTGGQKRGFLPLCDSIRCLTLAIENPPAFGEYRTFNQFDQVYSVGELAKVVAEVAYTEYDIETRIKNIRNPRVEAENHTYRPATYHLRNLGYEPAATNLRDQISLMFREILPNREVLADYRHVIEPKIKWEPKVL